MYNVRLLHANYWLLGHISQQLPLGLKPISTVSNTHPQFRVIELGYRYSFGQGVGQIFLPVDLLKVDVSPINDLSYQMISSQYVLGPLMRLWFLRLSNSTSTITV